MFLESSLMMKARHLQELYFPFLKSGVLTICTNHPGGNLVHKHKTIRFDGGGRTTRCKL